MFSSDLTDDQLRLRLGHMANTPCQVELPNYKWHMSLIFLFAIPEVQDFEKSNPFKKKKI